MVKDYPQTHLLNYCDDPWKVYMACILDGAEDDMDVNARIAELFTYRPDPVSFARADPMVVNKWLKRFIPSNRVRDAFKFTYLMLEGLKGPYADKIPSLQSALARADAAVELFCDRRLDETSLNLHWPDLRAWAEWAQPREVEWFSVRCPRCNKWRGYTHSFTIDIHHAEEWARKQVDIEHVRGMHALPG